MCFSRSSKTQQEMNFLIVWTPNYIQFVPLTFFMLRRGVQHEQIGKWTISTFFCISACWYETHERAMLSDFTKMITQWNDHSSQPQITQLTFINEIAFNSVPSSLRRDYEKHQKKRATGDDVWRKCRVLMQVVVDVILPTRSLAPKSSCQHFQIWQLIRLFYLFLSLLTQFRSPTSDIWLSLAFLSLPADCRHMTWIDNRFFFFARFSFALISCGSARKGRNTSRSR